MKITSIATLLFCGVAASAFLSARTTACPQPTETAFAVRGCYIPSQPNMLGEGGWQTFPGPVASQPSGNQLIINSGHTGIIYFTLKGTVHEDECGFKYMPPSQGYSEGYWYPFLDQDWSPSLETDYTNIPFLPDADYTDMSVQGSVDSTGTIVKLSWTDGVNNSHVQATYSAIGLTNGGVSSFFHTVEIVGGGAGEKIDSVQWEAFGPWDTTNGSNYASNYGCYGWNPVSGIRTMYLPGNPCGGAKTTGSTGPG